MLTAWFCWSADAWYRKASGRGTLLPDWFRRFPLPAPVQHLSRSAWLMFGRLFAVGTIAAFGLAVFVGGLSAIDSIFASRDAWYAEGHLSDLELRVDADDIENVPDLTSVPGIDAMRLRMIYPGSLDLQSGGTLRIFMIVDASQSSVPINTRQIIAGNELDPGDRDGVVVERSLSQFHGVKVG